MYKRQALEDVNNAISNILTKKASALDQLCCGNFGRLELLISASDKLNDPSLLAIAKKRGAQLVSRANKNGQFGWASGTDKQNPTLYFGMAGVGYQLLRLMQPEKLASLATWR